MAADVRVEFDSPEEVVKRIMPAIDEGVEAAAEIVADRAVRNIKARPSVPGQPVGRGGGMVSRPGETPTTQIGVLRNSIAYTDAQGGVAFVGTGLKYGRWLELGTSKMQPRPWLRRSAREAASRARRAAIRAATAKFRQIMGGAA